VLIADEARTLLDSIPIVRKAKAPDGSEITVPCVVGLRDRALIAVMTFALARIGAVVGMRIEDLRTAAMRRQRSLLLLQRRVQPHDRRRSDPFFQLSC
jgi:hypothetical protein